MKMKNSGIEWIGEIPEDWEVKRGKILFNQRNSRGNEVEEQLAATQKFGMYPQRLLDGVVQVKEDTDLQQFKTVHKNDYVISLRSFQGGFEMSDYEGVCSPAYQVFYSKTPIDYCYYKYLFKSDGFISKMNSLTVGIREGKNIQYKDFANSFIPVPPLETQQKIVAAIESKTTKIDALVSNEEKQIEKLKAYKQALITETVTKGLDKTAKMKDSGVEWIGEIPEGWECKKLKFIASSFEKGSGITKEDIVIDGDTSCVRYGEIYTKYNIKFSECKTKTNVGIITNTQYFSYGDVLFTCTGELVEEIGKSIVYLGKEKCLAGGDIVIMKHEQNPLFMGFALDSWYAQEQKSRGKTKLKVVHTSATALGNIYILLPPRKEQEEIGKYLDSKCSYIDRLISLKESKIEKLSAYKKSLIYEYVTGKKEIK